MPDEKTLESLWLKYRKLVVPAQASEIQVRETHFAFYTGLEIMFNLLVSFSAFPEEIFDKAISQLNAELEEFIKSMEKKSK